MDCRICNNNTDLVFSKYILGKYEVSYFKCSNCFFLQTEDPYWLDEAYGSGAIGALDTGVISRNIHLAEKTKQIILKSYDDFSTFKGLDFGGGEGITVRMLRDMGLRFYRYDLHAENLYARYFDLKDLPEGTTFDFLTAFEVFEHLVDPLKEIEQMLEFSDVVFFSTELQPSDITSELFNWWYLVPEGGQHISFYNYKTLETIARKFNLTLYSNEFNLHILTKEKNFKNPFAKAIKKNNSRKTIFNKFLRKLTKKINWPQKRANQPKLSSLISSDFEMIKKTIANDAS